LESNSQDSLAKQAQRILIKILFSLLF